MNYIRGNLLDSRRSIVHCVSADFKMGAGIAKEITRIYGRSNIRTANKLGIGRKRINKVNYILYMVTKINYWDKPTLDDMHQTLINLRIFCQSVELSQLAMPKIGCGLDRLSWNKVEELIIEELIDHGIEVDVYVI